MSKVSVLVVDDASFIRDLVEDTGDAAIVKAIIQLGHALDLSVIAEGVEKNTQFAALKELGCDEIQGFYRSKPLPPEEFEAYFHSLMSGAIMS